MLSNKNLPEDLAQLQGMTKHFRFSVVASLRGHCEAGAGFPTILDRPLAETGRIVGEDFCLGFQAGQTASMSNHRR